MRGEQALGFAAVQSDVRAVHARLDEAVRLLLAGMPADVEHPRLLLCLPEAAPTTLLEKAKRLWTSAFWLYLCCEEEGCTSGLLHEGFLVVSLGPRAQKFVPVMRFGLALFKCAALAGRVAGVPLPTMLSLFAEMEQGAVLAHLSKLDAFVASAGAKKVEDMQRAVSSGAAAAVLDEKDAESARLAAFWGVIGMV